MLSEFVLYITLGIIAVHLIFVLYFYSAVLLYKPKPYSENHLPISIIICARNAADKLRKHIPIWMSQNYPKYELIIVNDRSGDDTYDLLLDYEKKYPNLKAVHVENKPDKMDPKKFAITLGIKAAKYEHLLFTDADCTPVNSNWILAMQTGFQQGKSIVLGITEYTKLPGLLNAFIRFETFMTALHYINFALRGLPYMGVGRNLGYTKKLFFENTGFQPYMDVTGGDDDLFINKVANAQNTAVQTWVDAKIISQPKTDFKSWLKQKIRHLSVGKYYKGKASKILAMHYFFYVLFYFSVILLIFIPEYMLVGVSVLFGRLVILWFIYRKIIFRWKYNLSSFWVWIFDPIFVVYLVLVGFRARTIKKVKWN